MKVITTTHYNRPTCTRALFSSLTRCTGVEDYLVLAFVEPSDSDVLAIIAGYLVKLNLKVFVNSEQLGMWENKLQATRRGFEYGDYVIHFEDDSIPSKDCLLFFEQAEKYGENEEVFSTCAYNNYVGNDVEARLNHISQRSWFTPWGRALFREKTQDFLLTWDGDDRKILKHVQDNELNEIFPVISRVQNIGYTFGEDEVKLNASRTKKRVSAEWYLENHTVAAFAGDYSYEEKPFVFAD